MARSRGSAMAGMTAPCTLLFAALALLLTTLSPSEAYPIIIEVNEQDERCIRLNIPEDDDAHLAFVMVPGVFGDTAANTEDWTTKMRKVEEHMIEQLSKLTKEKTTAGVLHRHFTMEKPELFAKLMTEFTEQAARDGKEELVDGKLKSGATLSVLNPTTRNSKHAEFFYYEPVIMNQLRRSMIAKEGEMDEAPLEGYLICVNNKANDMAQVQLIMDVVIFNEEYGFDDDYDSAEEMSAGEKFASEHLTPLNMELTESIEAANTVLREMKYMEKREARMRHTADSINQRVRYFSYISIGVLFAVTYIQVSYLKRYFKKKKLM